MLFENRESAARTLARRLAPYRGPDTLVLGVPRGGVVTAAVVARELGAELDVVLVRKIPAPGHPELAIGAVDETGAVRLASEEYLHVFGPDYIRSAAGEARRTLQERRALYTPHRRGRSPEGRTAVVVDDGVATGATLAAAVDLVRRSGARRVVAAAPVAAPEAADLLRAQADEVVLLEVPEDFGAVSRWFRDFRQVTDDEVVALLRDERARRAS